MLKYKFKRSKLNKDGCTHMAEIVSKSLAEWEKNLKDMVAQTYMALSTDNMVH